jgi:Uncharacterized protein conserved in bacteria
MVRFTTTLLQFQQMAEKTGWTYIEVPAEVAQKLKPGNKKAFRVKGKLDNYPIKSVAILPMGGGSFILAVNATMRKGIGKGKGAQVKVALEVDNDEIPMDAEFMECLQDEPEALAFFNSLPKGHRLYFSRWIESAKTAPTKAKRIAMALNGLSKGLGFGDMMRAEKAKKDNW